MNAWLFQDPKQKAKLGDKCPWSVGWYDPEGRRKSKKIGAKSRAEKFARTTEGQLLAGTYEHAAKKAWADFRREYEEKGLTGATVGARDVAALCLNHFGRIIKPARLSAINSRTFATYVAARRAEHARKGGEHVSAATINKEPRHLRAVVRKAYKWKYLANVPVIDFLREPGKPQIYVTPEHFAKLYHHCTAAAWPNHAHVGAAEWWQALLVTAYMTGWRIGSLLALRRDDVDLDGAWVVSRAADNKGKRDQRIDLHPVAVEHLRKIVSFSPLVFTLDRDRRLLFDQFHAIQNAAGVRPEGADRFYGFHDLRRAFATMNADRLTGDGLQALMQHKSYQTTHRYINMGRQLKSAVAALYVPDLKMVGAG
jgi:integrase